MYNCTGNSNGGFWYTNYVGTCFRTGGINVRWYSFNQDTAGFSNTDNVANGSNFGEKKIEKIDKNVKEKIKSNKTSCGTCTSFGVFVF